jgi:hypothetical protein
MSPQGREHIDMITGMGMLRKATSAVPRILAGASALVLTAVAVLYAPVVIGGSQGQQGQAMATRSQVILAVLVISAASTWLLATRPASRAARIATNASGGFNLIWIFSFVGLPVVLASLLGALVATVPGPRRLIAILIAATAIGFGLGLVVLRLTQPPGEHIFG